MGLIDEKKIDVIEQNLYIQFVHFEIYFMVSPELIRRLNELSNKVNIFIEYLSPTPDILERLRSELVDSIGLGFVDKDYFCVIRDIYHINCTLNLSKRFDLSVVFNNLYMLTYISVETKLLSKNQHDFTKFKCLIHVNFQITRADFKFRLFLPEQIKQIGYKCYDDVTNEDILLFTKSTLIAMRFRGWLLFIKERIINVSNSNSFNVKIGDGVKVDPNQNNPSFVDTIRNNIYEGYVGFFDAHASDFFCL
ncbi:hypothetical protein QTN25_006201 [Entamoeba marina]